MSRCSDSKAPGRSRRRGSPRRSPRRPPGAGPTAGCAARPRSSCRKIGGGDSMVPRSSYVADGAATEHFAGREASRAASARRQSACSPANPASELGLAPLEVEEHDRSSAGRAPCRRIRAQRGAADLGRATWRRGSPDPCRAACRAARPSGAAAPRRCFRSVMSVTMPTVPTDSPSRPRSDWPRPGPTARCRRGGGSAGRGSPRARHPAAPACAGRRRGSPPR